MKRRLFSFVTALLLVVSSVLALSSCINRDAAYELITEAVNQTRALDSMDVTMEINSFLSMWGGSETSDSALYHVRASGLLGESPVFYAETSSTSADLERKASIYHEGEYYYFLNGELSSENAEEYKVLADGYPDEYDALATVLSFLWSYDKELLANKQIVENDDGTRTVTVDMDQEYFVKMCGEVPGPMTDTFADNSESVDYSLTDIKAEIVVNEEGFIKTHHISFAFSITNKIMGKDEITSCSTDVLVTFNNPGQAVIVTPPEGYEAFAEYYVEESAYDFVNGAVAKMAFLNDLDAKMDISMSISLFGMEIPVSLSYGILATGMQGGSPACLVDVSIKALGEEEEATAYLFGDYCYVTIDGEKNGYKVPIGEATEDYDVYGKIESFVTPLGEDLLEGKVIRQNEDGTRSISFTMSLEDLGETYTQIIGPMMDAFGDEDRNIDLTTSEVTVEIVVGEDGYVHTYGLNFPFDMRIESNGISLGMTCALDAVVVYNNPGQAVTVTPPEGYLSFEEISEE